MSCEHKQTGFGRAQLTIRKATVDRGRPKWLESLSTVNLTGGQLLPSAGSPFLRRGHTKTSIILRETAVTGQVTRGQGYPGWVLRRSRCNKESVCKRELVLLLFDTLTKLASTSVAELAVNGSTRVPEMMMCV
eukprot:29089-Rhodomonas_salina.1